MLDDQPEDPIAAICAHLQPTGAKAVAPSSEDVGLRAENEQLRAENERLMRELATLEKQKKQADHHGHRASLGRSETMENAYQAEVKEALAKLDRPEWYLRKAAVQTLGTLDAATLAFHVDVLVSKLDDADGGVRKAAAETLNKLDPPTLAPYIDAIKAKLSDSSPWVREAAQKIVTKVESM